MYLSLNLLKELVPNIDIKNINRLESILNSIGLEIEEIIKFNNSDNVVIGEILSITKPREGVKVNLCEVKIGNTIKKIICGADNIFVGAKVIVALPGAIIGNNFEILEREIMGVKSQGMICGYTELNSILDYASDIDKKGVIILDNTSSKNPFSLIGMDDTILDISIPSNRNDLNAIMWLVQEISNFYEFNFKLPKIKKNQSSDNFDIGNEKLVKNYFCLRFGFNKCEISWKSKFTLMNSGVKPSCNISDIAKVNSLLFGFPIFCIDAKDIKKPYFDELESKKNIIIDGVNYSIPKGTIVLKNNNDIICVVGMGVCDKYKVNNDTNEIMMFSSEYDWKLNNLISDLNKKFPIESKNCLKDLSTRILKYQFSNLIDILKIKFNNISFIFKEFQKNHKKITIDIKDLNQLLSTNIKSQDVKSILKSFGYKNNGNEYEEPINRTDVDNENAIYEDVLKVYGVNNIKPNPIEESYNCDLFNEKKYLEEEISHLLKYQGFYQIKSYNLCSEKELSYNYFNYLNPIKIENPLSIDREYMRLSLLSGVINTLSFNSRVNNKLEKIFEIQNIYYENKVERHLILCCPLFPFNNILDNSKVSNDIFYLKSLVMDIASMLNTNITFSKSICKEFGCDNDSLNILFGNEKIGYITRISPSVIKSNKINSDKVYVCELQIDKMLPINNSFIIDDICNSQNVWKELTFTIEEGKDLNHAYTFFENQKLFSNYNIISEFKKDNSVFYTISFSIDDINNVNISFEKIISLFNKNGLHIKETNE